MVSLDYGLAPEHPFPDGIMDCVAAYRALLEQGYQPENIALIGESAGGYYCLVLAQYLRDHGLPLPAGLCLVSPGADMKMPEDVQKALDADPANPFLLHGIPEAEAGQRELAVFLKKVLE